MFILSGGENISQYDGTNRHNIKSETTDEAKGGRLLLHLNLVHFWYFP